MPPTEASPLLLRFGAFELDLHNNELRRGGVLLKLTPQQFQVLRLLAENAGQLQMRETIQRAVWGTDTFVDFDRNLNVCITQIRSALNDDSEAPRYIQTAPKQGYRFIAPVERVAMRVEEPAVAPPPRPARLWFAVLGTVAACLLAAGYFAWRAPARSGKMMIAALPFDNLGGDPSEEPFINGLQEELMSGLGAAQPDRLGVIGRSSVMRWKNGSRDLHTDYLLEGSVRRSAGRVRITARLIKSADQSELWTGSYEQNESELFQMQEDAAAQISAAVAGKLFGMGPTPAASPHVRNREAYEAWLKGRYLQQKQNLADLARSIPYFQEAARLDPKFAEPNVALAENYVSMGRSGSPSQATFPLARAAAERAIALNDANAEAHNALANVFFWYAWNWTEAERHFARAIAINPSFSFAHHDYAFYLIAMGHTEQGLESLRRAIALDPLSTRVNMDAGWVLLHAHRFDLAIRQAQRAQELEPGLPEANACILRALIAQKKYKEALEAIPSLRGKSGNSEELLKEWYRQKPPSADPITMAQRYTFLGGNTRALDALEQAYAARSILMPLLKTEPAFLPLHDDPRFQTLARNIGLPTEGPQ
ncbi:MAG: winged helix-turn-helix domain-containing protein [Acidobacteriota bacterium]|nr:winged helix-turn-helix domain-containing protein [Acidobacteriota bacterium]